MHQAVVLGAAHGHVVGFAPALLKGNDAELAGVWDEDKTRCEATAKTLGVRAFPTLEAALASNPALAMLGAVPGQRAAHAVAAMDAGASVVADKPVAVTREALQQLKDAVNRTGKQIAAYYPYRGHPQLQAAKAAIQAGRIGTVVRVFSSGPHKLGAPGRPAWHWTRAGNGGALIDIGSHHFDICCWLAESDPLWVSARQVNLSQPSHPEFQDFAHAQIAFKSGALGHVEADWLNPASMNHFGDTRTWIQGTTGKIEIRLGDVQSAEIWTEESAMESMNLDGFVDTPTWTAKLGGDLLNNRPCEIPQQEIWRASELSLAAFESAEANGKPIAFD